MDEKVNPATGPAPSTDEAPKQAPTEAPAADAEQGPGTPLAEPTSSTEVPATASNDQVKDSGAEITMEDVMAASDEQLARKPIHRGMITTGEIIMLQQEGIVVDVGAKIEGMVPYSQLGPTEMDQEQAAKQFKAGDEIQVYVIRADLANSTITLSKKRADQERLWSLLQEFHEKEKAVEVTLVEKVRGGLVANLDDIRAFLPASQVDIRRVSDLSPYVDRRVKVRIIELNRRRNRVIISRRAILEEEVKHLREETLKRLEPGVKMDGEVVEVTDFGAFVSLGGVDGLVHRSELTHGRFNHPREVVKVGDKVNVEVLDMDLERERINLSMKTLVSNPWENVLARYSIGDRVEGTVTNLTQFGAFVEIEAGLEGLIHVSEMSWTKRIRHPKEVVSEGDTVEAMILKIDLPQERISLGLRQTQPDPWSSLPDRFPPGTEVTGPVTGITEFGVFMEIEEGIEGLVHISELSHDHIDNVSEHFKKGDEVTAMILNIDPVEQRASLSRKRMLPYTAENATEFGGTFVAEDERPAQGQSAGARRGRRGRRGGGDIDYDYSYVEDSSGSRGTTKLGDVYADLFAQFGLTDSSTDEATDEKKEKDTKAAAPASGEVETEAAPKKPAEKKAEKKTEKKEVTAEADAEPVDPENAIDAAEAAALLTAAFRQGKRPAAEAEETAEAEAEPETEVVAEAEATPEVTAEATDEATDEEA